MKPSEVRKTLQELGFTKHEALLFLKLVQEGAATATELARTSGVNRVQTYRALDSLEGRGFVEVTLDRPKRYAALAIEEVFDRIAEEKRKELEALEAMRQGVLQAWRKLTGRPRAGPPARLQIVRGRSQIYRTIRRLVDESQKEVWAFTTTKGLRRSYRANINEALLDAMARGVKSRLIADIRKSNAKLMSQVGDRVPLRHLTGQRGRYILADRQTVLAFLVQDEQTLRGDGEVAMWTNSPDFVKAQTEVFRRAWASGVPAEQRLAEL